MDSAIRLSMNNMAVLDNLSYDIVDLKCFNFEEAPGDGIVRKICNDVAKLGYSASSSNLFRFWHISKEIKKFLRWKLKTRNIAFASIEQFIVISRR